MEGSHPAEIPGSQGPLQTFHLNESAQSEMPQRFLLTHTHTHTQTHTGSLCMQNKQAASTDECTMEELRRGRL